MQFTVDDLMYAIPGIVCMATYCLLIPGMRKPTMDKLLLAGLIISFFEYILFSSDGAGTIDNPVWQTLYDLFVFFLLPILLAVAAILLSQWRWMRGVLHLSHPVPTAWDWKFSGIRDARYMILTLNSGEMVYGLFDRYSFAASSELAEKDIYLSRTYTREWGTTGTNDGLWVKYADIRYIEFIDTRKGGTKGE